jgi:aerotaxis receptor
MRTNLPITRQEYTLSQEQTLVSVTDLKGRITYCNPAFIEASGFSRDELLGQPHNLVRHPDMPEEAFRDLWDTIQSQLPWSGLVKNRRKNGDFYWVQANATPMMDGDQMTGFLSVRTAPSAQAVAGAEALYARMRVEAESGRPSLALHRGMVVRRDLLGRLAQRLHPGVLGQLAIMLAVAFAAMVLCAQYTANPVWQGLLAGAGGALLLWGIWALTLKPMQALVKDANRLASGDLAHRVDVGGKGLARQLQQALMQMSVNLRTVVSDVRVEVGNLSNAMREIADGNQDLSARTESQASSLQQTAASMEQINGSVVHSSDGATRGAGLARATAEVTERSNDAVLAVANTMQGIADSSKRISEIIHLIEGVAFQTNILALNAAVEAARAGEQGRGFAVVAAEVRSLAHRTADAAKEIKQLITDSAARVSAGSTQTAAARDRMAEAMAAVTKTRAVLDEISASATQQKTGISQINEAVAQMDSLTQQNAAMVEELAAAAKSVQSQVEGASSSMRLFRLTNGEKTLSQVDAVALRRVHKLLQVV